MVKQWNFGGISLNYYSHSLRPNRLSESSICFEMQDFDEFEEGEISDDPASEIVCYSHVLFTKDMLFNM